MNTVRLLRSLPALVFTWLAVLSLQVAQPGGLVHHWTHAFGHAHSEQSATELASSSAAAACETGLTDPHADHDHSAADVHGAHHDDCGHPASTPDGGHEDLCNLCAHFAFLGGVQSAHSGIPAVAVAQALPTATEGQLPPLRMARERYAARAPPAQFS